MVSGKVFRTGSGLRPKSGYRLSRITVKLGHKFQATVQLPNIMTVKFSSLQMNNEEDGEFFLKFLIFDVFLCCGD
jgi:hypothetical protein